MGRRGRKKILKKEETAEDWCFQCKDGGTLLICDVKQCLKAYHSNCVGKDDSFLKSESRWSCNWHTCYLCPKPSSFHCFLCPKAVCRLCIRYSEIVHVRGKYGLCTLCLKLALLVEENANVDSDGESVDLRNRETFEGLFMEYYVLMKEKCGLNIEVLCAVKNRLRKGQNCPRDSDSDEDEEDEEDELVSDYESRGPQNPWSRKKGAKRKPSSNQRKGKSSKKQFDGWGSILLIQFLSSIGKDTSQKMTQHEVTKIIEEYVREHKLVHPDKKRKIICDESLQSVLGRKIVSRNGINNLLEAHFAENQEESEEDLECSSEEDENRPVANHRQRTPRIDDEGSSKGPEIERPRTVFKSNYAAVLAENIKLVYLKRSLVCELCKQHESFGDKVTGSFVRVKADPYDTYQKNSYQLMQVTGIKKASNGEEKEINLLVSEVGKEVPVRMLSNEEFTEAECEDLRSRVETGMIKKPTVVELEHKAKILHQDITKHWIARELVLLQKLIDRANEKGWRRELSEYMEKKKLLQTSAEQERLLGEVPRIIPEEVDCVPVHEDTRDESKDKCGSPTSTLYLVPHDKQEGNRCSSDSRPEDDPVMTVDEARPKDQSALTAEVNREGDKSSLEARPKDDSVMTVDSKWENYRSSSEARPKDQSALTAEVNREGDKSSSEARPKDESALTAEVKQEGNKSSSEARPEDDPVMTVDSKRENNRSSSEARPKDQSAMTAEVKWEGSRSSFEARPEDNSVMTVDREREKSPSEARPKDQSAMTAEVRREGHRSSCDALPKDQATMMTIEDTKLRPGDNDSKPIIIVDEPDEPNPEDPENSMWHVSGNLQKTAKYSISLLKRWSECTPYASKVKVWKENQSEDDAIWLTDAIKLALPRG